MIGRINRGVAWVRSVPRGHLIALLILVLLSIYATLTSTVYA